MSLFRRNMRSPRNIVAPPGLVDETLRMIREGIENERIAAGARSDKDGRTIHRLLEKIMRTLDEVLDVVTAQRSRIDSMAALLSGLKKQIDDALGGQLTPSQQMRVDSIFNQAQSNTDAINQAIDANDGEDGPGDQGNLIQTKTTVTSSNSRTNVGEAVSLSAAVTAINGKSATGAVTFYVDGEAVGSASLDSTGVGAISSADFAGGAMTEGEHEITAKYTGDGVLAASESEAVTQTVVVPVGNPGGTTFADIRAGTSGLDPAGQGNLIPGTAPAGPSAEWPGDPNNFGQPTTQTRNTRPGLPDTPGVPNAGASAQGGSAVAPGTRTNAPGDTRRFDPQGNPVMPSGTVEDVNTGQRSYTGGSALSPGGTRPASTTTDTTDTTVPDTGTLAGGSSSTAPGSVAAASANTIDPNLSIDPSKPGNPGVNTGIPSPMPGVLNRPPN